MKIISKNSGQTKKIAADLAKKILKTQNSEAAVVALVGDLGAGKTTFAQGFAKALGIRRRIVSPTFLIMRNYQLLITNYRILWHVDAYRINKPQELTSLGFKKILADRHNILLIEWAEKIKKILPRNTIWINFQHGAKENKRLIEISP